MNNPSEEIVVRCREFCSYLKSNERDDIVKKIRDLLPSGMTGPLTNEKVLVGDMIGKLEDLTRSLCGNDLWKKMADHLGIRPCYLWFHDRKKNPAKSILEDVCRKRRLTIGDLYDVLCKCDANALADEFL
ncbi:uncharacterized protein LOC116308536 [Actinia tenebrosa]|uniref:Uncharacterized protein LOC116308536 n=1 Tax=Actinia tenebrosa TaxID=6105 RepID=A0A6P8JEL8_ACTTE|nr:uncharacterized protein LOC116308536 [Actinia tenebrosa]